jgi:DNA-directed RNA polymerase II subunit RPB7
MFFVHNLERELFLHPSFFDAHAEQNIRDKLHMDMEGKIIGEMMVVTIIEIDEISEPKLVPGTGMARYDVSYRAIVWRPFKGEVVDGMVSSVLANGFFVDVGGLNVFVSKAVCLRLIRASRPQLARCNRKIVGAYEERWLVKNYG